jgi:hypothetical protein
MDAVRRRTFDHAEGSNANLAIARPVIDTLHGRPVEQKNGKLER